MNTEKIIKLPQLGRFLADLKAWLSITYAKINGYYSTLVAGAAENLVGRGSVLGTFFFRTTAGTASVGSGSAEIKAVRGKGIVWNQLVESGAIEQTNSQGTSYSYILYSSNAPYLADNHKYYVRVEAKGKAGCRFLIALGNSSTSGAYHSNLNSSNFTRISQIITKTETDNIVMLYDVDGSGETSTARNAICIDLTQMFGAGNEPSTVAEFEALYNAPYYPYNAGAIRSLKASGIKTTGFNQWDEEWELGTFDSQGEPTASNDSIRSKNFCAISGKITLHLSNSNAQMLLYDADKVYIDYYSFIGASRVLDCPVNARYFKIKFLPAYGTTYNNDCCVSYTHSGIRNGDYEAYWDSTLALPITTATGKLNGQGTSVTIFPNGMMSAGNAYDELQKTKAIKRIGSRTYQTGDENDSSVLTDLTTTLYILSTPEEYILDTELNTLYREDDFGTEEAVIPANTDSAPLVIDVKYPMNAVDTLRNLPKDYVGAAPSGTASSLGNMLEALKTAGVISAYTISWDSTNQRYNFSITRSE